MLTKSRPVPLVLILLLCTFTTVISISLNQHYQSIEDLQYDKLNQQQKTFENQINSLLQDMNQVQKNVSTTPNSTDKVILLQNAILSQREKVFNMQNELIPPFSLSKSACLQLTNQQKIDLLDRITSTKQQITNLQQQIQAAPKCDKISGLQKDAQKQLILLQSLQKTIMTECKSKSILTPTIYQTNIYADGWILGDQNIDDLIEEYYQRNIRYHNITNCPLDKPFFDGEKCMICTDPEPVFNILTKECTHCPEDQDPDSNLRKCVLQPHYTKFATLDNWAQEGAPMPIPQKQLIPCPPERPYYNGKKCETCLMPKYWSIMKNACVDCSTGTLFDTNDRKCQKPQTNELTILQNTRWVTNDCNITRIINERIRVLNQNKTTKVYKMCPTQKPFYDGIVCINCLNQFNIDTRKCVLSPNKTAAYNENVHCYVKKQSGFETDPRAANYTAKKTLNDSPTPNCKKATPYYDGIACIDCLDPFQIFDVDTKRCTACDPMDIYNNTQHKCIPRQKIYISTNEKNLMATPVTSIDDYHAEIEQMMKDNPEAVIILCKKTEYSDYQKCINCSTNEYFNVETKKCQICDGLVNTTTQVCQQKSYLYTNLNENSIKRIVAVPTTIQQQNATINDNLTQHVNARLCPVNKPFFDGTKCTNCTKKLFNMTSMKCVEMQCTNPQLPFYNQTSDACEECPQNMRYVDKSKSCQPIVYVTNTNAIYFYIEEGNATKQNLEDEIFNLESDHAVITCETSHPYWNGTECVDCAITRNVDDVSEHKPYFNLRTLQCQGCNNWDNTTHKCPVEEIECPQGQVLNTNTSQCENIECPQGQVLNPNTSQCQNLVTVTDVNSLTNNYIESGNSTKDSLASQIESQKATGSVVVCPSETPFFSKAQGECVTCVGTTPYFDLATSTCKACENYNTETHQCQVVTPRFDMNIEDYYGTIFS